VRGPFHRALQRWRRGSRRRRGAVDVLEPGVEAVGCVDDLFVGVALVALVALLVVVLVLVGPVLLALVVGIVEFVVVGSLAVVGGAWAWIRRRPKLLVATGPDGRRWVRPAELGSAAQDAQALAAGMAPELLGYAPHGP
jgi:hypothetical protein